MEKKSSGEPPARNAMTPLRRWRLMPGQARGFAACSGVERKRGVSGSFCISHRQSPLRAKGRESSCWQTQGASPVYPINWLTLPEKQTKNRR
jgi:hypothetical protein